MQSERAKWTLVFVLHVVAIVIACVSMSQNEWYSPNSTVSTQSFHYGLARLTIKFSDGREVHENLRKTGCHLIPEHMCSNLVTGGIWILSTGSIALALVFISLITLAVAKIKNKGNLQFWSVVMLFVATVLMIVGSFSYCRQVYIGWSFLMFALSCFLCLAVSISGASSFVGATVSNKRAVATLLVVVATMVIIIAAMATFDWVFIESDSTQYHAGLVEVQVKGSNGYSQTVKISSDKGKDFLGKVLQDRLVSGGNAILGTGIVSLVLLLVSLISGIMAVKGKQGRHQAISSFSSFVAGILTITGALIYARKLDVSYSFMEFFASMFLVLLSCVLLVTLSVGEGSAASPPPAATYKDLSPEPAFV